MDNVNKTMYIPLYGKANVSKRGIILSDSIAENIWEQNQFPLKRKSKSKWLSYFMAMRAKVFGDWASERLANTPTATVLHIGCGLDSRVERINGYSHTCYDVDFPEVIEERKKYYTEISEYKMICGDASKPEWLRTIYAKNVIVLLEGVSMYLKTEDLQSLFVHLQACFESVEILMDIYTPFGAKMSRVKNPIKDVGITEVYGIASSKIPIEKCDIAFIKEHTMTPQKLVNELKGFERFFFSTMFSGSFAKKLYRLYEYKS